MNSIIEASMLLVPKTMNRRSRLAGL